MNDHEWIQCLENLLYTRNPLQEDVLNPGTIYGPCKGNIFLKNMIEEPGVQIGEYTYAHMDHLEGERVVRTHTEQFHLTICFKRLEQLYLPNHRFSSLLIRNRIGYVF
jgi:hypothetical protein